MTKDERKTEMESAFRQIVELQYEVEKLKVKLAGMQEDEIPEYPIFNNDVLFAMSSGLRVLGSDRRSCSGRAGDYNTFHTKEYAEILATKSREIAMLLHCKWYCDRPLIIDFSDESVEKWCVWYDRHSTRWTVDCQRTYENTTVYFTTEEAAQKAAAWMNQHSNKEGEVLG